LFGVLVKKPFFQQKKIIDTKFFAMLQKMAKISGARAPRCKKILRPITRAMTNGLVINDKKRERKKPIFVMVF